MKMTFDQHVQRKSIFNYQGIGGTILDVNTNMVMRTRTGGIEISLDSGKTWAHSFIIPVISGEEYGHSGHILNANNILFFTGSGRLFRSTNGGVSFNEVDMSSFGTIIPPLYHGIDSSNATVCIFAEYPVGSYSGAVRVFKTVDAGATWSIILTQNRPDQISHFHTVNYNEMTYGWIITSGDTDPQIKWWSSTDGGIVFNQIVGAGTTITSDQRYRTCNMIFTDKDEVMWSSDSGVNQRFNAVYKAPISDMSNPERVFDIINVGYGLAASGNIVIAPTNFEGGSKDRHGYIYVSTDGGKTFHIDMKWPLIDSATRGGFFSIHGPDAEGSFYCNHGAADLVGASGTNNRATKMALI